ncbi:hypothetical protein, partial [Neobacillus vireti]|uniref:hypothetical protein n=1 Tax=Neobacillus vireti TaxID=220686 RepID=UPI002FFE242E
FGRLVLCLATESYRFLYALRATSLCPCFRRPVDKSPYIGADQGDSAFLIHFNLYKNLVLDKDYPYDKGEFFLWQKNLRF